MKKIKISAGYGSCESLTERLISQFKTELIDLSDIEFVCDDSYDIIVFYNYVNEEYNTDKKAYVFPHEPTWVGNHQKTFSDYKNLTVFGFDKNLYKGNCIESKAYLPYGGRGEKKDLEFWNYNTIKNDSFKKDKSICSFISTRNEKGQSPECLYDKRVNLVQYLYPKNEFIDFYGGWVGSESNLKGFVDVKYPILKKYKFCLTIENSNEKNYISEKFYDCVLTDTIPVYFGCKNIKEIYPEDGYFLIEDINDVEGIENLLNYIISHVDLIYEDKLKELKKIKTKYFLENNLLKKIINL